MKAVVYSHSVVSVFEAQVRDRLPRPYPGPKTELWNFSRPTSAFGPHVRIKFFKISIRPMLSYAASVWAHSGKNNWVTLQRIQNKALRIITKRVHAASAKRIFDLDISMFNIGIVETYFLATAYPNPTNFQTSEYLPDDHFRFLPSMLLDGT